MTQSEDDTFRRLLRCPFEELSIQFGSTLSAKAPHYITVEQRDKIIVDNHWTVDEWKLEVRRRYRKDK